MTSDDDDSHAAWQQQMDEAHRRAEEEAARYYAANPPQSGDCPACHSRPFTEKYVWVRRGERYHREYRCANCIDIAQNMATDAAIRKAKDNVHHMGNPFGTQKWEKHYDADGNILETVRII